MSEVNSETPVVDVAVPVVAPIDDGSKIDNLEDALKELDKVRKEAASRRVKNREVEEKAQRWEEHVQSQKTELEKLSEENNSLKAIAERLQHDQLRESVARATKLDPEDFEFLIGSTEEELKAKAEKLNSRRTKAPTTDFYAGQRGTPVAANAPEDSNVWFKRFVKDASSR